MSGGVDSSLVAVLMAERGCKVVGATMSIYPTPPLSLTWKARAATGRERM
jgi:tRNA U34 2-thiouridine synthase MnmA/TrmU